MSDPSFDPYYKWLGIPASEQPANHYRLLGLTMFESDAEVIDSAAVRQTAHVRTFAIGQHGDQSQAILTEIAKARLALLNSETKKQYDDTLREHPTQSSPLNDDDKLVSTKLSTPGERCPCCGVELAISQALFGKIVQCAKCKARCRVDHHGKAVSLSAASTENSDDASSEEFTLLEPLSLSRAKSGKPLQRNTSTGRQTEVPRSKWILATSFLVIGIAGVWVGISLLWEARQKPLARAKWSDSDPQKDMLLPSTRRNTTTEIESRDAFNHSPPIRRRHPRLPIEGEPADRSQNRASPPSMRAERNATPSVQTIVAREGEITLVNGPIQRVVVTGVCSSIQVGGSGYHITIERMVNGEIKLSGFDHRIHVTGSANKILGSGLRHQLIVEEIGQVVMSGNGHELYFVRSKADLARSLDRGNPLSRSTTRFKQIQQIATLPPASIISGHEATGILERVGQIASVAPPLAIAPFDANGARNHQQLWADHLGVPVESTNGIGMKFVVIPPGEFTMGSEADKDNEQPTHHVTITKPFQIGVFEVTQEEYYEIMGDIGHPHWRGKTLPITNMNWASANKFCEKLTETEGGSNRGYNYRLPTEAEWEWACRAGSITKYSFGNDAPATTSHGRPSTPVGQHEPNAWGIHDMHHGTREWCSDVYRVYTPDGQVDPQTSSPNAGTKRTVRGGSSSWRTAAAPGRGWHTTGFRIVRTRTD